MYVTSSILVLEATCSKTKVAVASTFYVGFFSKHAEETVGGKRPKCDRPLRRSIFCGVSSLLLFSAGVGGGMGKSTVKSSSVTLQKKAADRGVSPFVLVLRSG